MGAAETGAVLSACASTASSDDAGCCWICLDAGGGLARPCGCPRASHPRCLARWQLQQAGRPEERACRFCGGAYADWRGALGGAALSAGGARMRRRMGVSLAGCMHKLVALPGPEGKALFKEQVRALLGYAPGEDFDVAFDCIVPGTGERLQLSGFGAYDAAVHCAAAAAAASRAERDKRRRHAMRQIPFVEHEPSEGGGYGWPWPAPHAGASAPGALERWGALSAAAPAAAASSSATASSAAASGAAASGTPSESETPCQSDPFDSSLVGSFDLWPRSVPRNAPRRLGGPRAGAARAAAAPARPACAGAGARGAGRTGAWLARRLAGLLAPASI